MQPAVDPFHPLLRVIDRYRQDVHALHPPPADEMVDRALAWLGQELPPSLHRFLERWNGAALFRGALRIRAVTDLAPASAEQPDVVLYADGPGPRDHWAFVPDGQGGAVFGRWHPEEGDQTGAFEPMHDRFDRWLFATVRLLDENVHDREKRLAIRLSADPDSGYLLFRLAEDCLAAGDPEQARDLLRRATASNPELAVGWERLGDCLMGEDQQGARGAYLRALRAVRLPRRYATTDPLGPALVRTLNRLFPAGDPGWEQELTEFLDQAVQDAGSWDELALVEAAAVAQAQARLAHGRRRVAHAGLLAQIERARGFRRPGPLPEALLLLARIETDLGLHDEAERRLRSLRHAPPPTAARAALALGRIVVGRQEPWAGRILAEARPGLEQLADQAECALLEGQRQLLRQALPQATEAFDRAAVLARKCGDARRLGLAALGRGDVHLAEHEGAAAEGAWREARTACADDPEILQRVLVRRGDLYRITGDSDAAARDYAAAAEGFAELELPLREAWALLRLGSLGDEVAIERALTLFKTADLAAGVAAADAVGGRPDHSLDWHLARAAEHARDRANAQRARPPLVRADADRPERRIGAHRMAIAEADASIVQALAAELDTHARTADLSSARLSDPSLARYVAAADLLSAHRSYDAAEAMLHHLLEVRPSGVAGRCLIAAMARSPNAALVDGLLDAVAGDCDPNGTAAAAEVLGWRKEPAAVAVLRQLAAPDANPTVRKAAIIALGRIGDALAVDDIMPALDVPVLAEAASVSLLLLGEWAGVDFQAQALAAQGPNLGRTLGEVVGRFGGPAYLLLLMRTSDAAGPAGIGALQGLGYLGDPRAVPRLIDATAGRDPQRARVAAVALELITGHREDPEEALLRNRWLSWWEQHQGDFAEGRRYRHGRLMDPGLLIERLSHDDSLVRRTTYDELVISTGCRLPFDADGPFRVQVAHQSGWRQWWRQAVGGWGPGTWTFHGDLLG